jgi:hypothetical protein
MGKMEKTVNYSSKGIDELQTISGVRTRGFFNFFGLGVKVEITLRTW